MKNKSKIISASLSLMTSMSAVAGLGGLNVQSNLGEPFSASIVVTGNEAKAVLQSGSVNVMGGNIHGTVVPQGNGNAVIRLRSNSVVNDPIVNFVVSAGNQTRQYTAMVNPAYYRPADAVQRTRRAPATRLKPIAQKQMHHTILPPLCKKHLLDHVITAFNTVRAFLRLQHVTVRAV